MSQATGSSALPSFNRPPVTEVVLGARFQPLPLGVFNLAQTYSLWQPDYSRVEEHPAIPAAQAAGFFLELGGAPDVRFWFIDDKNSRLLQVQKDRLVLNWRLGSEPTSYPRYKELRKEFTRLYDIFVKFLAERAIVVTAAATEVTYINVIGDDTPTSLDDVLNFMVRPPILPSAPLESDIQIRFDTTALTTHNSNLIITTSRDTSREPSPLALQLSSHGQVDEGSDITVSLDASHHLIVTSFRDITTPAMHKRWELT